MWASSWNFVSTTPRSRNFSPPPTIHALPHLTKTGENNDVISGMAADNVGMDASIKFGDSRSNGFRDIRGDFVSNK